MSYTTENFLKNEELDKKINMVLSQTNYNNDEAMIKLKLFNYDAIKVIQDYMGITEKKKSVVSINQEIFNQIRTTLDKSMKDYRDKNPINIEQVIDNFNEADEKI